MSKRKKITRVDEYAMRYLHDTVGMDTNTISQELDITVSCVEKFLHTNKPQASIPTATSNTNSSLEKNIVSTETRNKNGGVSIMTQHGSSAGDDVCKNTQETVSRVAKNAIYRPRG